MKPQFATRQPEVEARYIPFVMSCWWLARFKYKNNVVISKVCNNNHIRFSRPNHERFSHEIGSDLKGSSKKALKKLRKIQELCSTFENT